MNAQNNPVTGTGIALNLTRKDMRAAATTMGDMEARFLVDRYYTSQRDRIRTDNQVRAMTTAENPEPTVMIQELARMALASEKLIQTQLDEYTQYNDVGKWLRSIRGIGPVTSAGLLAHIDIRKAPTAGAIWKFAGIDGQAVWKKGEKRPWNATLKTLLYKIGESFVKTCNKDDSFYGKLYKERKALEVERNARGEFREQAAKELASKSYKTNTPTYLRLTDGRLSDAHLHARARRYAVKIFISHLHHVMYNVILNEDPPKPFALAHLEHAHMIRVPNTNMVKGWIENIADDLPDDETPDPDRVSR